MIGRIAGQVAHRGSDHVLIDVHGVGYIVYVSERTLAALPGPGGAAALYTELVVREDLLQLYGFLTLVEKEWHRLLTSVQGVGAKASVAILGTLGTAGVGRAVALGDWNSVKAAPGIGPKLAQRIVNELKGKAPAVMAMADVAAADNSTVGDDWGTASERPVVPGSAPATAGGTTAATTSEALSALSNLGYGPGEAAGAIAEAAGRDPTAGTSDLIRAALRLLAPKG